MYCFLWGASAHSAQARGREKGNSLWGWIDAPALHKAIDRQTRFVKNQLAAALPFLSTQAAKASINFCRKGLVLSDSAPDSSKKLPAPPR